MSFRAPHAVEKVHLAALQGVLGSDDREFLLADRLLEDLRAMSQRVAGGTDVGPYGLPQQAFRIVPE